MIRNVFGAKFRSLAFFCLLSPLVVTAGDESSPGAPTPGDDFSPPPVPEFMLRKPERPLTLEEMQRQADEAARRARTPPRPKREDPPTLTPQ